MRLTYVAPQTAYAASAALSSQTGPAFSLGRGPNPYSRTLACSHTEIAAIRWYTVYVKAKIHQIRFRMSLRSRTRWGSLHRCPESAAGSQEPTS